jgi:hypothetical protein
MPDCAKNIADSVTTPAVSLFVYDLEPVPYGGALRIGRSPVIP